MIEVIAQTVYNKPENKEDKAESDSDSENETEPILELIEENKKKEIQIQSIKNNKSNKNVNEMYFDIKWLTGC